MPFEKVEQHVDFPAQERATLAFWKKIDAFAKRRTKNVGKPRWSFLDGPITANNPMGVHHAWGRTYKDTYQRFYAMTGHELRYQNGFDCQGLWVEVEVEKELKLTGKRDIETLVPNDPDGGIAEFVKRCKARVDTFARVQTAQSIRLGYWMDWDDPDDDAAWRKPYDQRKSYFTCSDENNYTIWGFLKKCHDHGFIYRGYDAMPWCPRCGVGISEMELKEGYKTIEHKAVFVKFPLKNRPGENLLVWTTTPWTLTSNVGAAVNPELTYLKVKSRGEIYYVAKGAFKLNRMQASGSAGDESDAGSIGKKGQREWLDGVPHLKSLEQLFKEKSKDGFEIVGEVKGAELLGWEYEGPFDEVAAQDAPFGYPSLVADTVQRRNWAPKISARAAHRVIAWKDVGETEGTGIVHIAPGCGKEDFSLGKEYGLPPVAPLDEYGTFLEGFGDLTGKSAVDPATAELVFFRLQQKGKLFAVERYVHRYPHCWRCKTELLFRLVDEWFIGMGWRNKIMEVVRKVEFLPESINGQAKELDWLKNMGDWMISKKRFWGLALPIWVDDGEPTQFEVIGSLEELRERAVEGWEQFDGHSPHRPYVDKIKIRNPRTGNLMTRIPDVGNPWLDAGIVPFSTMGWRQNRAEWEKWFPADFITESFPGQFRNWFYAILAMSTMLVERPPMKVLLGHGLVRDQNGEEMHKSKGNSIEFNGAADSGYRMFVKKAEMPKKQLPAGALKTYEETIVLENVPTPVLVGEYAPIGADVIRWLYCRHNPGTNINFGPGPTDEIRSKFHLKLWHSYAFFCNYARLDGFDPTAPLIPLSDRPDIDRWILSDLQLLVRTAHEAFRAYRVQDFCLAAEAFVDDKLSNWYIRRNRRRFWKSEAGSDKTAAYQTLYAVLTTLTKLLAPVVPFLAETLWQNLRLPTDEESVHLCDYPVMEESLIDTGLSAEMDALLRLVTLGSAARNASKLKVRQPLAEMRVQPGTPIEARAVERFREQLKEELNLKAVTLHDPSVGPLLTTEVKLNAKEAKPRWGSKFPEVMTAVAKVDPAKFADDLRSKGSVTIETSTGPATLEPIDVTISFAAADGFVGTADRATQVMLDVRITPDLMKEGIARDIIRPVQDLRKKAGLEMDDRIVLHVGASGITAEAFALHREYIANETLAVAVVDSPPPNGETMTVKIEGSPVTIALAKHGGTIPVKPNDPASPSAARKASGSPSSSVAEAESLPEKS